MLPLSEAGAMLGLPPAVIESIVAAGYLVPTRIGAGGPEFALTDVKAFLARNADNGAGAELAERALRSSPDPQDLLDALDRRAGDMAWRVFRIFATVFPEAESWTLRQQAKFVGRAKARFEAILRTTGSGAELDSELLDDLRAVGESAAGSGAPLPQLLLILRISRDLVVQTAVELAGAEADGGYALSLLLTRILPAMDRLTDALADGYWRAIAGREEEALARYRHVVERASDGVYEVDRHGKITYANSAFARIVGRRVTQLIGADLVDALRPSDPSVSLGILLTDAKDVPVVTLGVTRADGVRRLLSVQPSARHEHGRLAGFQGVVRDETVDGELEADRREFATLLREDLRGPLATIVGLASTLEAHADELTSSQGARIGQSIRSHVERVSRLADDLHDIGQLGSRTLRLYPRRVPLRPLAEAALASVSTPVAVSVAVPDGLSAVADPRRLEQVIANLVDNAVTHGAAPVTVAAQEKDGDILLTVSDHGPGVAEERVPALFDGRKTPTRSQRERARGRGMGLALVRGLAEAMGGRVWYERDSGVTEFVLAVPGADRSV